MNAFSRSWELTKASWHVLRQDKELLLFPVLSVIFSIVFVVAMLFPTVILAILNEVSVAFAFPLYLTFFSMYFGLAFIATFFNTCVVYTTKTRFEGKNATFSDSIRFSFSKIHLIAYWSVVASTVGIILRMLENAARNSRGGFLIRMLVSVLGAAWSIVTLFVVPGMVYYSLGPFDAIKKSVSAIKKTWGENLIAYVGFGFAQMVFFLVGVLLFLPLFFLSMTLGPLGAVLITLLGLLYLVSVALVFGILKSIFHTALFVYAEKGKIPKGYSKEMLKSAFVDTSR
jgi:uncharacterized Tic20 family protein